MRPSKSELMTVGELRRQLSGYPDDTPITFGCLSLKMYRLKWRGDILQIEFDQTVYDDEQGNVYVTNTTIS
jgi:hypothetical protein